MRMHALGMSNAELARLAKVRPPTSFHWASGKTKSIKGEPLLLAARALGVTPDWLATGKGQMLAGADDFAIVSKAQEPKAGYEVYWPFELVDRERYMALSSAQRHLAQVRMMDEIEMLEAKSKLTGT